MSGTSRKQINLRFRVENQKRRKDRCIKFLLIAVGLIVGLMVGLTGVGGGALLVPILVLLLHVPAIVAVGTGALFVAVTKVGAAWSYHQSRSCGYASRAANGCRKHPGRRSGRSRIGRDPCPYGDGVNAFLKVFIGIVLILTPALRFSRSILGRRAKSRCGNIFRGGLRRAGEPLRLVLWEAS